MTLRLRSAIIALAVVILDRWSKLYIQRSYAPWDVTVVIPQIFNIVHAENPGGAFSMLAEAPPLVRSVLLVGVSAMVMTAVGIMLWRTAQERDLAYAYLAGAGFRRRIWQSVGPRAARIGYGFLAGVHRSYEFPSFNVADSAITIGAALLVIDLLRTRKTPA
jgi:signal peptidase II